MQRVFAVKEHYQKIKIFIKKYERWLLPVTLVIGFLVDYITFVNIQISTALFILFIHFVVCACAIAFIYAYDAGKISPRLKYLRLFAPFLVQFNFGGMLSNSFIFYWFSGSIWVSWPFIVLFVGLMVGNDALRHYYVKPTVQLSVYFFALLTVLSVSLPFIFNSLSALWFVLSELLASLFIIGFIWLLVKFSGTEKFNQRNLSISIVSILIITNLFYFTNLIPPVPLAIREAGVYNNITRSNGQYILQAEQEIFWERLLPGKTVHINPGQPVYVYSSIYAPKELNTSIVHEWQYYDQTQSRWTVKDRLSFNLVGGRQEGFRGYSLKTILPEGKWRVFIKTQRGQTLGRVKFKIELPKGEIQLEEIVR